MSESISVVRAERIICRKVISNVDILYTLCYPFKLLYIDFYSDLCSNGRSIAGVLNRRR